MQMAPFPFMKPTTCATKYFEGMESTMCTRSSVTRPSSTRLSCWLGLLGSARQNELRGPALALGFPGRPEPCPGRARKGLLPVDDAVRDSQVQSGTRISVRGTCASRDRVELLVLQK